MSYAYDFSTNTSTGTVSYDIRIQPQIWATDATGTARSILNYPDFTNVQVPATQIASYNNAKYGMKSTGTTNSCISVYASGDFTFSSAGSVISNMYGLYYDGGGTGSCTLNNHYGLYVNQPAYGTNCFAGYFGGQLGIGTTSSSGALTITNLPNTPYGIFFPSTATFTGYDGTGTQINQSVIKMNQVQQLLPTTAYRGAGIAVTPTLIKLNSGTNQGNYNGLYMNYQFTGINASAGSIANLYGVFIDSHMDNTNIFNITKYIGFYMPKPSMPSTLTNNSFGYEVHAPSSICITPAINNILLLGIEGSTGAITCWLKAQGNLGCSSSQISGRPPAGIDLSTITFNNCTGTLSSQNGIIINPSFSVANGSIGNVNCISVAGITTTNQPTITNFYGVNVSTMSASTGTSNAYGLYVTKPSGAVNNYTTYMDTGVGIGVTPPFTGLQCAGNIVPSADNLYTCGNNGLRWTNIWATSGVVNSSDRTMKTDIQDETLGLDFLSQLRPVTYRWKNHEASYTVPRQISSTGHHSLEDHHRLKEHLTVKKYVTHRRYHHGLIAQEVKETMDRNNVRPENAGFWIDSSVNEPDKPASQGLIYTEFIPIMIKSIQELKAELQDLRLQVSLMYK